jgi:hypothetical protein
MAQEFLHAAADEAPSAEAAAELRRLEQQYLDYADFLERNSPGFTAI